ncbi:MAG TPA: lysylphosphatidylglycerol synthase domain-containing protein [Chitinophagaceae bacterium]|nr:lysylphosphatidylglycerol synthase domain-containing protein [Chitinophagaceae bacterium]
MPVPYKNIKIFLNYFLGPLLFIWLSVSIYHQVRHQPDLGYSLDNIKKALQGSQRWKCWAVIGMVLLNWGIEARKWQLLLRPLEKISIGKSFKAILAGLALALNTPNRIGEYGGRILYVQEGHRIQAVSLTIAGSFSQLIITLLCGLGGLIFLLNMTGPATAVATIRSYSFWINMMVYIVAGISIVCLLIYFRLGLLFKWMEKLPFFSRGAKHLLVMNELSSATLRKVLGLSFLRYMVFAGQYVLMIQLMQLPVPAWQAFWLISVLFLVMAVIPTIALADLGIRGQASLELFGLLSADKLGIIAASAGVWCINLVLPALIGSVLIAGIKLFDNK